MITTTDGESLTGLFFGPSFFASHILAFERNVVRSRRLRIPVGEGPAVGSIHVGGAAAMMTILRELQRGSVRSWVRSALV
ncbi:hypothetical protein [Rhodococcus jostii]|uniref:hypothetical protein n=1 Tax=Rhodococcus jostii TaxID=132919 RepID=UPI0036585262